MSSMNCFGNGIKGLLRDRKFRLGSSSALLTVLVVAIVVIVNLIVRSLDWSLDLTANQMYSLSEQTLQVLDNLERDVKIYALYRTGNENLTVSEMIRRYTQHSKRVSFETVDPTLNPQFVQKYKGDVEPELGSIIVASGDKFRVIPPAEFFNYTYNYYYGQVPQSIAIEQKITSAIMYVSTDKAPVIYRLVGHNELDLPASFTDLAKQENYTIANLDLLTVEAVPEDAAVLLLYSPEKDLTAEEDEKLRSYLNKGGRLIMFIDVVAASNPVLQELLTSYGVRIENALIVEGDAGSRLSNPFYLVPKYQTHAITEPLTSQGSLLVVPMAQPITILQTRRSTLTIEPLLKTSNNSWARDDFSDQSFDRRPGDPVGPFNVAVAITDGYDNIYSPTPGKLIVVSTSGLLLSQFDQVSRGANSDFVMNAVNWLYNAKENITVRPKEFKSNYVSFTYFHQLLLAAIFVIVVPVVVFLTGFIVWTRRRNL